MQRRDFLTFVLALLASGLSWLGLAVERRSKPRPHPKPRPRFPGDQAYYDKKRKPNGAHFLIRYQPIARLSDRLKLPVGVIEIPASQGESWYMAGPVVYAYGEVVDPTWMESVQREVQSLYLRRHPEWREFVEADTSGCQLVYNESHEKMAIMVGGEDVLTAGFGPNDPICRSLEDFWSIGDRIEV